MSNTTEFKTALDAVKDTDRNGNLTQELKNFFENSENRKLMRANKEGNISKLHASEVAKEMEALKNPQKIELKTAVVENMKNLTVTRGGKEVKCADILS